MDAAAELYAGSKDWSAFQNAFQSLVETEWENTYAIMRAKANAGDVSILGKHRVRLTIHRSCRKVYECLRQNVEL